VSGGGGDRPSLAQLHRRLKAFVPQGILIFVDSAKSFRPRCGDKISHRTTLGRTVLKAGLYLLAGLALVAHLLWNRRQRRRLAPV
jgi:hypothetical protein